MCASCLDDCAERHSLAGRPERPGRQWGPLQRHGSWQASSYRTRFPFTIRLIGRPRTRSSFSQFDDSSLRSDRSGSNVRVSDRDFQERRRQGWYMRSGGGDLGMRPASSFLPCLPLSLGGGDVIVIRVCRHSFFYVTSSGLSIGNSPSRTTDRR